MCRKADEKGRRQELARSASDGSLLSLVQNRQRSCSMARGHEQFRYETIPVCSTFDRLRATPASGWLTLCRRVCLATLPDPPGQRPRADAAANRRQPRLPPFVGSPRHPRLPPRRHCLLAGEVLPTDDRPTGAGRRTRRVTQGVVAPVAPPLGQGHQPVDAAAGRDRLLRTRLDTTAAQRGGHPPSPEAVRHRLEAGQALDHQPRPGIRAKKKLATD